MIFTVRDGQKWDGPGIAHPCSTPHWRLGGIPQGSSKGNKHLRHTAGSHPKGFVQSRAGAARAELRVTQECFIPQASFCLLSAQTKRSKQNVYNLYQVILFSMRETNLPAGLLLLCWAGSGNSHNRFSAPFHLQLFQAMPLPISMNEVNQVSAVCNSLCFLS